MKIMVIAMLLVSSVILSGCQTLSGDISDGDIISQDGSTVVTRTIITEDK